MQDGEQGNDRHMREGSRQMSRLMNVVFAKGGGKDEEATSPGAADTLTGAKERACQQP